MGRTGDLGNFRYMKTSLYYADITPLYDEETYQKYYSSIPEYRQFKADEYRAKDERIRSVAVWTLLEKAYRDYEKIESMYYQFPNIAVNSYGKSDFIGTNVHFNLSHSGIFVLCALSQSEVGCDIEQIAKDDFKIAERFFHQDEINFLKAKQKVHYDTKADFYRIWTLKEAFLKAKGCGLNQTLKSFSVVNEINYEFKSEVEDYYIKNLQELENINYCISVSWKKTDYTSEELEVKKMQL